MRACVDGREMGDGTVCGCKLSAWGQPSRIRKRLTILGWAVPGCTEGERRAGDRGLGAAGVSKSQEAPSRDVGTGWLPPTRVAATIQRASTSMDILLS